jgi:hypothetical protein
MEREFITGKSEEDVSIYGSVLERFGSHGGKFLLDVRAEEGPLEDKIVDEVTLRLGAALLPLTRKDVVGKDRSVLQR